MNLNKPFKLFTLAILLLLFCQCRQAVEESIDVSLPDGELTVGFMLKGGIPFYQVRCSGKDVIKASKLGFTFKDAAP